MVDGAEQVVDLGAGQGRTLVEVAHRAPRCRLTGIDLNPHALKAMAARLPQARGVRHDLADPLPLADSSVDAVISHNTMECLQDPGALLTEITRVLRPQGRVVLGHTDFPRPACARRER
ncbi:MAG: class I SAM-dependent methyltransferase [Actinomycetota bacterium]|nr:class I SAM-dependent methyltransferase [Actinomycetota bacterium]